MSGNVNHFQGCNIGYIARDQMNGSQTNGGQLNSSQSVGGNMNGDQINSGQMNGGLLNRKHSSGDRTNGSECFRGGTNTGLIPGGEMNAGLNLVGRTNAGPNLVDGTNAGLSPGGGTNGGLCPEGGTNTGPSTGGGTNAGQMIIARELTIKHSENKRCWAWVNDPTDTRFTEVAELLGVKLLSIKATKKFVGLLAKTDTKYGAYLIFKTKPDSQCLGGIQKAIVFKRPGPGVDRKDVFLELPENMGRPIEVPVDRPDGWKELKLGQFYCYEAIGNNYVVISIKDPNTDNKKTGLIIAGIEIRPIETAKDARGSNENFVFVIVMLILFVSWLSSAAPKK